MKRLAIAAAGSVLVVAGVVIAVWASVGDAPWEGTTATTFSTTPSPAPTKLAIEESTAVPLGCEEARKAYAEAEQHVEALQTGAAAGLREGQELDSDKFIPLWLSARDERLRALQVMNEACR